MTETFFLIDFSTKKTLFQRTDINKKNERENLLKIAKKLGRRWSIFSLTRNKLVESYETE